MKRLLFVLPFLLVIGCGLTQYHYRVDGFDNNPKTVAIGNMMLYVDNGYKNDTYHMVESGIRSELILTGVEDSVLYIQYREYYLRYNSAYLRDGFTQNLRYNVAKSKVVRYGNLEMEILGIGNNEVSFRVLNKAHGEINQ